MRLHRTLMPAHERKATRGRRVHVHRSRCSSSMLMPTSERIARSVPLATSRPGCTGTVVPACGGHPVRLDSLGCSHSDQPRRGSSPVPVRATGPLCYFHHRVRYTSSLSAVPGWRRVLSSMLALLNIGDEVVQWLGAGANDKAGDQQVGPKRRLSTAVGADACKSVIFSWAHRRKARPVATPLSAKLS